MNIQEVRLIARSIGIQPGNINKPNLIRLIQQTEGNFDCYGSTIDGVCDQGECLWRNDCLSPAQTRNPADAVAA